MNIVSLNPGAAPLRRHCCSPNRYAGPDFYDPHPNETSLFSAAGVGSALGAVCGFGAKLGPAMVSGSGKVLLDGILGGAAIGGGVGLVLAGTLMVADQLFGGRE